MTINDPSYADTHLLYIYIYMLSELKPEGKETVKREERNVCLELTASASSSILFFYII